MFKGAAARLAALYTVAFALSVVVLGATTLLTTRASLRDQFDGRIHDESAALVREFKIEGLSGVVDAVLERDQTPGALEYGLNAPDGHGLAGRLGGRNLPLGWSSLAGQSHDRETETIRVFTSRLPR